MAQCLQIAASDFPLQFMMGDKKLDSHTDCDHEDEEEHSDDKRERTHHGNWRNTQEQWGWADSAKSRRGDKRNDARVRSMSAQEALMSNTLEEVGKDQRGDNELEASDDLEEEEDDDVHPDMAVREVDRVKIHGGDPGYQKAIKRVTKQELDAEMVSTDNLEIDIFDAPHADHDDCDAQVLNIEVIQDGKLKPQYVAIATSGLELDQVDDRGNKIPRAGDLITDGYIYIGGKGHEDMETCSYIVTDKLSGSYITTAALRRSGLHPQYSDQDEMDDNRYLNKRQWEDMCKQPDLKRWIEGEEDPHSSLWSGCRVRIDDTLVLSPFKKSVRMKGLEFTVIPSNEMKVVMGYDMVAKVDQKLEDDESPLQESDKKVLSKDLEESIQDLIETVQENEEISQKSKDQIANMLREKYVKAWRTKYELTEPAKFPPMKIRLKPGAQPHKIRRKYNWSEDQRAFLRKLLRKLVDVGVISRVDSEWCSPVVLVIKPDGHWRLCVDPTQLNKNTVPMVWDVPKVREVIQEKLKGMKYMCRFDFCSMFWQIPLAQESRRLFSFYAGDLGSYMFNRVAMGALNSSIYTQRMVSQMFQAVKKSNIW